MQTIKASEFKAKCLKLMDAVNQSGEGIVITKNGKPVSRLVPYRKQIDTLYGLHKGLISSGENIVGPIDDAWSADE